MKLRKWLTYEFNEVLNGKGRADDTLMVKKDNLECLRSILEISNDDVAKSYGDNYSRAACASEFTLKGLLNDAKTNNKKYIEIERAALAYTLGLCSGALIKSPDLEKQIEQKLMQSNGIKKSASKISVKMEI